LFTGTYEVTVGAPNMKTYKTSVQLLVAQAAIINPVMTAGDVTQQVEVSANTVQLTTTDNGTIASTLENDRVNQLPMNGRVLDTLVSQTTPGVEGNRANGLMAEGLEYVADGVSLSNRQFGGMNEAQVQTPDPDSIQEVRVEAGNASAQYSEPSTAVLTTKSGTNSIHGSLFETARNNAVGIARSRANPSNFTAPHLVRNEYGASAGGPLLIPHLYHGKNKSFWFFAFERYSLASANDELATVPTKAMKQGDFSGLVSSSGILQQLYDPATTTYNPAGGTYGSWPRQPFQNNQIPIGRLSPTSKILDDIIPNPTSNDNPLITSNLSTAGINNEQLPTFTFRFDHAFNENNRAYLRFTSNIQTATQLRNNPGNGPATVAADGVPANASAVTVLPSATFATAIGFTHVFSPTFFMETIVSQQWFGQHNFAAGSPNTNFEQEFGVPNNFGTPGFPFFGINDTMLQSALEGTFYGYGLSQIVTTFEENLTKTIGLHQLQFGGRYRHERFGDIPDPQYDYIDFGANGTALENPSSGQNYSGTPNTGFYQGDFFLGSSSEYEVQKQPLYGHYRDMEFDGYIQDNFHASRNLTLNLGLRYEGHPAAWTKYDEMEGFDLKNDAMVTAGSVANLITSGFTTQAIITNLTNLGAKFETASQAGLPATTLMNNYDFTFGPRLGLAWQPFGSKYGTVLRGAYGRYIYPMPTRSYLKLIQEDSPYTAAYVENYNAANQSPDGLPNYQLRAPQTISGPLSAGTPIMGVNSANVVDTSSINAILPGVSLFSIDPDFPPDYVTQVNTTIEQPLKGNSALRISWLWVHGTNLDQEYRYNNAPGNYVWEMQTGTTPPTGSLSSVATLPYDRQVWGSGDVWEQKSGWSNDNALQVNYQKLYHHGVAYQIFYVWSKPFRVGGNSFRDNIIYPQQDYANSGLGVMSPDYGPVTAPNLGPTRPAGIAPYESWRALDRFENYQVDTAIPKQHIVFNGIYDLPFGRGKKFMTNANHFVDEVVGGFQIAGDGSIISQDFAAANGNWGPTNPIHIYKHNAKITDCRSGTCHQSYEWFNGYIAPTVASGFSGSCTLAANNVQGLPSNWAPYSRPIDTDCVTTDAAYKYYGGNDVDITLLNGNKSEIGFSPGQTGTNPASHTILNGPMNYTVDLSVFKVFPITEKTNLRFNVDAFNALNVQGYNNPNTTDGTEAYLPNGVSSSYNTPRQLQFTLRLTF
jgi:hypothetical protein